MTSPAPIKIPHMDLSGQTRALKAQLLEGFGRVLDNTAFCLGKEVAAFESAYAQYCGTQTGMSAPLHAIAVNSGTSALHLALLALGVGPGDDVVTTPFTFVATAWAISYCGARPVFADIDPQTFLIDPKAVERAITPKTKAIIPVHLYGQPADMDALNDIGRRKGLPVVEDACQAHGATFGGKKTGSLGTLAAFSFYPSKNLGACGEGGAALTSDASLAAKIRALREHGSVKRYYHDTLGFNYRMEGVQGMALAAKLPHLDGWNARRQHIAKMYGTLLEGGQLKLPHTAPNRTHVYHLYVVRHPRRDALADHLKEQGIGTALHYPVPLHFQKAYAHLGLGEGAFPQAESAARECLSLPMFPELSDDQVRTVASAVRAFAG